MEKSLCYGNEQKQLKTMTVFAKGGPLRFPFFCTCIFSKNETLIMSILIVTLYLHPEKTDR